MNTKLKLMARTGYAAKGVVYAITGILTFLAAFDMGGKKAGKLQVIEFLDNQPAGKILLALMALGLLCYSAWRLIQSTKDPENIGNDKKGMAKRTGFFISGLLYFGLAVSAVLHIINSAQSGSGSQGSKSSFLASNVGLVILGIVGLGLIGVGIVQFTKIKKEKFKKNFSAKALSEEKRRKTIFNTAYMGLSARGVLFLILGFFALKAAINSNPEKIKTTTDAFSFLEKSSYGAYLLGIVAAGMVAYAIYTFMLAKYRRFK